MPQSDLPGSGTGPPRTKNPAWSGVVRINPWQIRGSSLTGPWWSGVILGWSLVVWDGPGSAPDVSKCLKHPGRSGAVREALQSGANPALSGCNRVLSVTHPGSPCVVRVSSVSRPGQSGTFWSQTSHVLATVYPRSNPGTATDDPRTARIRYE